MPTYKTLMPITNILSFDLRKKNKNPQIYKIKSIVLNFTMYPKSFFSSSKKNLRFTKIYKKKKKKTIYSIPNANLFRSKVNLNI